MPFMVHFIGPYTFPGINSKIKSVFTLPAGGHYLIDIRIRKDMRLSLSSITTNIK
jgi:hypothetical protein